MSDPSTVALSVGQIITIISIVGGVLCGAIGTLFGYVIMSMKQQREDCLKRDQETRGELAELRGEDRSTCIQIMTNAVSIIDKCVKLLVRLEARLDQQDEDTKRRRRDDESGMHPKRT